MQLIQSIHQLNGLRDGWNALADRAGQPTLRHEWMISAANAFHAERQLAVVALSREGRLVAIAPLASTRIAGIARLELIGASALHEPGGLLYEDAAAHARLLDALLDLRSPLVLQRLPAETLRVVERARIGRRRGFALMRRTSPSLSLRLDGGSGVFEAHVTGKLRYDLNRARKRASAVGAVDVATVQPSPENVEPLFDEIVAVEGSGWKGRQRSSVAADAARHAFFSAYARFAAALGILRLFFLRIGGTTAAVQMGVELYGRLWILKIGYDERLAQCSPGLLLTAEAIRYACERGLSSYEFLGVAEPWEARWRPEPREHGLFVYYPSTFRGCLGASVDMAGAAWRRLMPASSNDYRPD